MEKNVRVLCFQSVEELDLLLEVCFRLWLFARRRFIFLLLNRTVQKLSVTLGVLIFQRRVFRNAVAHCKAVLPFALLEFILQRLIPSSYIWEHYL